jgi:hypothetical protein
VRYVPLMVAVVSVSLMILGRILTNRFVRTHSEELLAAGGVIGRIPLFFSILYLSGLVGLVIACVWSFISVGWWAALVVTALYLAASLVRSELSPPR